MRPPQLSLRTAITVPFALLFAATVVLQAFMQHRQVQRLIDQESERLLAAITATSRSRLAEYLEVPFEIQRGIGDTIGRQGLYAPGRLEGVYTYLHGVFSEVYARHAQISLLSFGSQQGEFAGIRREPDGSYRLILKENHGEGLMHIYRQPVPGAVVASYPGYDPRERPWYAPVARAGQALWSPIYTTAGERGDITISAASPVYAGGRLIGVMDADVRLDSMSRFLREEALRGQAQVLVVDAQGYLVAHSEPGPVLAPAQPGTPQAQRTRLRIGDSASPVLRKAAGLLPQVEDKGAGFSFGDGDERYFGRVTPYQDARGLDWRIVAVLPESALLGETRAQSRHMLLWSLAIAAFGLLLGLWAVRQAVRPILRTAEAANRLAHGEWQAAAPDRGSALLETSILVRAFNDMAERLQQSFQQMRELLLYDSLTHSLTRRGLLERSQWAQPRPAVLSLVGLDDFRALNDSVGHGTGDRLLQAVSERLRQQLPEPALLARLGGDEFAVLHFDDAGQLSAPEMGEALQALFAAPFSVGADEILVRASVGTVQGLLASDDLPEWLRNASMALGEAKRRGRNQSVAFSPALAEHAFERARLSNELRQALEKDEFLVHYQPVVDLASGRMVGAEALLRWHSPTRGMVPPGLFIPTAEESDLILALGDWVLHRATHDIARQLDALPPGFDLHVNVSARQLIQSDFPATLREVLSASRLPPHQLTLELTESVLIDSDVAMRERIAAIHALGVRIAIDDFGTGYSSLAYLSRLAFDCIKIDQSFVRKLLASAQDEAIVAAVLHMAHGFGVTVVAEGVETTAEAERLRAMGCPGAQGYWFGRPAPLEQLRGWHAP
ncbi:EAL domain-containing protein [Acidovorax sp. SDU_ACID1]|uniref:bifunctional diguanylate cyclase/phosphodiesterase n=1 Tax=Acidovorax sp. SDU_ACID1 TaxID=3136632 RepID=UPI003872FE28